MADTEFINSDQHYRDKMKALSIDLCWRIVAAYKQREGTQGDLAKRFAVSASSVARYLRLDREKERLILNHGPAAKGEK